MAMPLENGVVVSEKSRISGGGEMLHQRQWLPDARDGFIFWLRGEFAAANAMIDSLCDHLMEVGEMGEYDAVLASLNQRRCNWNQVLYMQQYFPVTEVTNALQQVGWRRQQRRGQRRGEWGVRNGQRERVVENGEKVFENGEKGEKGVAVVEEKRDMVENPQECSCVKLPSSPQGVISNNSRPDAKPRIDPGREGHCDTPLENGTHSVQNLCVKENGKIIAKTFVANEIVHGKTVNLVDGMELYNDVLSISEVPKIVTLVNDIRAAGKRGELQGNTFLWSNRPSKGHGREIIQLGLPIANALPEAENVRGAFKDLNMLPIPQLLRDLIDRLVCSQILTVKPESCIIDVFNEGDYSLPQMWPYYGRPVSVLLLTECEMTFGKHFVSEYMGAFKSSLSLSLQPGSMLVMQRNSVDLAKYALPSLRKQRVLITLIKQQPLKSTQIDDIHCVPSPAVAPISHWAPPPSRSPTHVRHPMPKHYGPMITNEVLPAQPVCPRVLLPNGMPPNFMPAPVVPPMPFPAPVSLPPHQPPRLPLAGTGVFLPPGSTDSSSASSFTVTDASFSVDTAHKENGLANRNKSKSSHSKASKKECNGSSNGATGAGNLGANEMKQQDAETETGKTAVGDA